MAKRKKVEELRGSTDEMMSEPEIVRPRKAWEYFFSEQRNPVVRSQLLSAMLAGTVIPYARVPVVALLDVVVLATVAREFLDCEIVDSYYDLVELTDEMAKSDGSIKYDDEGNPHGTYCAMRSIHGNAAYGIIRAVREQRSCTDVFEYPNVENRYLEAFVSSYLNDDMPEYFDSKLTKARKL